MLSLHETAGGGLESLVRSAIANNEMLHLILLGPESGDPGWRNILFFHSDDTGFATGEGPRLTLYIPEPSTVLLLAFGALGLVAFRRRKFRNCRPNGPRCHSPGRSPG